MPRSQLEALCQVATLKRRPTEGATLEAWYSIDVTNHPMHDDEIHIDERVIRGLVRTQLPQWRDLTIERVESAGTDNALFRLGSDMVLRLPLTTGAASSLGKELEVLPLLGDRLPFPVPTLFVVCRPDDDFPHRWTVYGWIEGASLDTTSVGDEELLTADLVSFLRALRAVDIQGPTSHRGQGLAVQDGEVRAALPRLRGLIDAQAAAAAWEEALSAPGWREEPVWVHGDLLPGNILVAGDRLAGIIDWSAAGVGDPACDLIVGWACHSQSSRERLRAELKVDDATWARGRGWALSIGLIALPYYKETNPGFASTARHLIDQVLTDPASG